MTAILLNSRPNAYIEGRRRIENIGELERIGKRYWYCTGIISLATDLTV